MARWLGVLLVWLVSACGGGPGTGGTGTGPNAMLDLSYSATAVGAPAAGAGALDPGSGACASPCGRAELRLQEALVELSVPCARFTSTSPWNASATLSELPGTFTGTAGPGQPATLRLQFNAVPAAADRVTATVLDAQGRILSGPVELVRNPSGPGAGPGCS